MFGNSKNFITILKSFLGIARLNLVINSKKKRCKLAIEKKSQNFEIKSRNYFKKKVKKIILFFIQLWEQAYMGVKYTHKHYNIFLNLYFYCHMSGYLNLIYYLIYYYIVNNSYKGQVV